MKPLLFAIALSFGADTSINHYGMATGRTQEILLPTQNPYVVDAIVAGEIVVVMWGLRKLHETHPKAATAFGWGIVGFRSGVAIQNLRAMGR